jgi:cytochrome P450
LACKLTAWNIWSQAGAGDRHIQDYKAHQTYGTVVRVGPNILSFNSASALKEIYARRKANTKKTKWYNVLDMTSAASTHSETDIGIHAFKRRVLGHAFSTGALRSMESFMINNIQRWIEKLGEKCNEKGREEKSDRWSDPKDVSVWNTWLAYDIMGDISFGTQFGCLDGGKHRGITNIMFGANRFVYQMGYHPYITIVKPLVKLMLPILAMVDPQLQEIIKFDAYFKEQTNKRMAAVEANEEKGKENKDGRKDFMYYVLSAKDPETGKGFSKAELDHEAAVFITAGSDTTSTTMSALLHYLLHSPTAYQKAVEEVRGQYEEVEDIWGDGIDQLKYLRACVKESLRLAPPVPSSLPREVLSGGLIIDGEYIPAGTEVGVSAYVIHHNPEYFPEPFAFRPERWLVDENDTKSEEGLALARSAFCPFSLGTRGCIGKSVAYLEIMLAMARLLFTYDMRLAGSNGPDHKSGGQVEEYVLTDGFVTQSHGPLVEFKARS